MSRGVLIIFTAIVIIVVLICVYLFSINLNTICDNKLKTTIGFTLVFIKMIWALVNEAKGLGGRSDLSVDPWIYVSSDQSERRLKRLGEVWL